MKQTLAVILAVTAMCLACAGPSLPGDETIVERGGDALMIAAAAGADVATLAMDDPAGRPQLYKGFLVNLGTTYGLKFAVDKQRPDQCGNDAFPSAQTSIAFQGA